MANQSSEQLEPIYPDSWRQEYVSNFIHLIDDQQPPLCRFLVRPMYKDCIADLERWATSVQVGRDKLISRFRDKDRYLDTIRELKAIGSFLDRGLYADYEPDLDGVTPDWLIITAANERQLIVESFQCHMPETLAKADSAVNRLWDRLNYNPPRSDVRIQINPPIHPTIISDQQIKQIRQSVFAWIANSPSVGAKHQMFGFEFICTSVGEPTCQIAPSCGGYAGNSGVERLRRNIGDKASKYRSICEQLNIPLLIVIYADPETSYKFDELVCACTGQFDYSHCGQNILTPTSEIVQGSPFESYQHLCGAGWLHLRSDEVWEVCILKNTQSTCDFPDMI